MDIAYSSFLRKVDSYSTKSKRLKVNGDILESSRKHQGSNLFPSSRSKILDYKKRLKLVNEMIDKEIDLFLYETEKQQHDNIKNSLKHLDSLRNLLDTNYEISSKKDIVILLLELLDHTLKSDTITSYNETHVKNNFPTKCCQLCGCSCKMQSKRVQSLSPGWKLSARELGKPYLTKVFDLNSDDRLEKCSICNTTIIGKHSAGICEWCLDGNPTQKKGNLAILMRVYTNTIRNPKLSEDQTSPNKSVNEDRSIPKNPEWLNFHLRIGNSVIWIRDSDSFLCRVNLGAQICEEFEGKQPVLTEMTEEMHKKRSNRFRTPSFMKLTEASAGKIRSSRRPLPEIEPQSSKESLIQKILEIKSTGKTVVKSLQVAFEEQLMTPLDRIKDIKEYTCISLSNYTRNVRSLISGIHEFLPEHALGVEKCFKGNVQLIDFMMDWYSAELRKVQDNLDNHSESGVKTAEYVKTIDNLRERLANVEHQHKSKLERMKDQLSNNHQLIKLYEMELNQKTTEKNYY